MNMFKKNGGFTLVELIVVIAILAILAGVAVPAYSGYISRANEAADTTALGAIKTAAMATFATEGTVEKIDVAASNGTISAINVTIEGETTPTDVKADADFVAFHGNTLPTLKAWTAGAVWYAADPDGDSALVAGWNANAVPNS